MKASNANKVISVLLSVAMCPMMVPSAAFAAEDDAASGPSSPSEQTQLADQSEGVDTGDTIAPQSEATGEAASDAVPVAGANGEGAETAPREEGTEAAVAEVNGTSYPSLQEAINVASRNATVKLLADTKENVIISTPYVSLDLNGYTLNGGTEKGKPALTVTARVSVKDSSEAKTGTIMREDTAENSGVSSHYVIDIQGSGWLTFESGNVTNNSGNESGKGASLVRVGDDSVAKYPGLNIKGGNFTQNNFVVIKVDSGDLFLNGGTLNSTSSYAIENWHRATVKGGTVNGAVAAWTYSGGHNSDLAISGGTVNGNVKSVTYDGAEGKMAKVSITGGTVNGTLDTVDYSTGTTSNDPTKASIEVTGGTFSTDPSRYLVEGSAATPNGDGTFGVAKAYLAQVGGTSYYTMDEAFKAQTTSGEAITLLRDYTTGSTFSSGTVARVVDLNGHTWTCTGTDANSAAFEINNPNASLTVKNGKIVSSQLIGLIPSAMGGTITYDNSTLTFEDVEASTTATSGIETNGNNANDTVVLKNSTLNVPNGFGIYFPSSGTLTIDNSTINAKTMGAQVCSGNLNVTAGSVITVSGDPVAKTEGDGAIQDGAAISIVNRAGYKGLGQIAITGGTFTAKGNNAAIKAYAWNSSTKQESAFDNTAKTVAVYGGTFSSAVPQALCAEGCDPIENPNGTYGVSGSVAQVGFKAFNTLQAAIDAAQDGETVTLLADATEDATVAAGKNITLDLGGKTLTNTNAGKATLTIVKGATATVKNGNIVGGTSYYTIDNYGTATLEDVMATAGNTDSSMIRNDGTMTIESGSYSGGLDVVKSEEGSTLTINGGKFELSYAVSNSFTGVIYTYGTTSINGGEFVCSATGPNWASPCVVITGEVTGYKSSTKIAGGKFVNKHARGKIFHGYGKATSDNFEVTGGTFNKSVSDGFLADGFTCAKNSDGTYGVVTVIAQVGSSKYTSLQAAITAAGKGKTVQLLNDTTENVTIAATKQITLDLNGHTLNGGTGTANAAILNKGTVTITDTSADKTGTIKRDDQGIEGETSYYVIRNIGTMVIDWAIVENNSGYPKANSSGSMVGSSLICNGDDDSQASLTINGGTFTQLNFLVVKNGSNGTLTVNDGTLTSNHSAVQNWNKAQILGGSLKGQIWTDAWVEGAIGETVIGGDAQFSGEIVVDITGTVPPTLKIEGGSLDVTSWRMTSAAAAADATIAVSGGTFTAAVPEDYCAEGYVPATNANGTYGVAVGKFTVQVTSRTTTSDSPVANVSGGGSDITYAEGTTVTASAISGYKFVGWFVNEYAGTPCSTDLTCTVKPTDNCTMIAVYEPVSGGKFWLSVTASEFTVNGGAVQDSYLYEQYAIGASVTVNFTGSENFLYWVNASNKVVSTDKSYTFTMGSETTLKAVYGKARQNQATVVFVSHSDQIISSKAYTTSDTIQFPVPPIKMGCTFTGWSMAEDQIHAAMANNGGIIEVRALYTEPSMACKVTVVYPEGVDNEDVDAVVGKTIDVTAKDIEGKTFSYWTDNDGNVLGYTKTLKLAPSGDMTVKAIYSDEATEAKPVISISEVSATKVNEGYAVTFMATRAIPEGYQVVEQGILWSRDAACGEDGAATYMQFDSNGKLPTGVNAYIGNSLESNGVTRLDISTKYSDRTFYGRGYMILKSDAGELLYIYTDTIASGSYDSLTK